jgi:hypothetical protein
MDRTKMNTGLEALAGEVPLLPAKASNPLLFFYYPLSTIHFILFQLVQILVLPG